MYCGMVGRVVVACIVAFYAVDPLAGLVVSGVIFVYVDTVYGFYGYSFYAFLDVSA